MMDVNGFIFHCNVAIANCAEAEGYSNVTKLDFVKLKDMQTTFKLYKSWEALLDNQSELVMFLHKYCKYNGDLVTNEQKEKEIIFDETKLKVLSILWGKGHLAEKAHQLYDLAQEEG